MITANDLKGIMTMMPAFTTKDGDRIDATDTVDTDELTRTVDKPAGPLRAPWRAVENRPAGNHRQQQKDRRVLEDAVREVSDG